MSNAPALTSSVIPVGDVSSGDREAMWDLYRRFYAGTHRALFDADLAQKDSLLLLRDGAQRIQGFSTIAVSETEHEGRTIRYVFSGDTIVDREYWGSQALAFSWLRYVGGLKCEQPEVPLYWFLIVKGHRTYRYLPAFAREFYPHWERATPAPIAALMTTLARERFGSAYDEASGVIRYPESHGHLAAPFAEATEREASREDVAFFLKRNAGYRKGDELVCLCELSSENMRPLSRRLFESSAPSGPWESIAAAASRERASLDAALADPAAQQAALLRSLLTANRDTRFGREHGFADMHDVADFRRRVPLRRDTDYSPWFDAAARGEPSVLTAQAPVAFESTGGTSGAKHIPYPPAALDSFRAGVLPWLGYLLDRFPRIAEGVAYVAASPLTRPARTLPCGVPLGLPSDAAYLGAALAPALSQVITVPPATDLATWSAQTYAHLASRRDLTLISVWSPTLLLEILAHADKPAAELWPNLQVVSLWMDGASAPYAARVAEKLPDVHLDAKGVLATESVITVRTAAGCVPALTSAFLEFIDADGDAFLSHELRAGQRYRVALTTPGGLYRYDIGDEFECTGHAGGAPLLRFVGRVGVVSDLVGEKLTDSFVAAALSKVASGASLVPRRTPDPHYELWLDTPQPARADLAAQVEQRLRANPQYAYARELGQLRALEIVCAPGFARHRALELAARGGRLGDAKSCALILDRTQLPGGTHP